MEYIYIRNVTLQNVKLIKDTYGTLMAKTRVKDLSYKERIWKTHVEDSCGRLISKTCLEDSFYKDYKGCIWNTRMEDSSGRLVSKTYLEDSFYKHYKGRIWNTYVEDLSGRMVWNTFIEDSYQILMLINCKYFISHNVLILRQRIEMFGRLVLNISSTISILTVHSI